MVIGIFRVAIVILLCFVMAPYSEAQERTNHVTSSAKSYSGKDQQAELSTLAKLVRNKIDLSWLFEPVLLKHSVASPEDESNALLTNDLARFAVNRGLRTRADVAAALGAADALVLAEAARRSLIDSIAVPDSQVAAMIAQHPGRYDEYQLSHIFVAVGSTPDGKVRSETDALAVANSLKTRIAAGEPFAKVAVAASEDTETASQGGALSSLLGVTMNPVFFTHVRTLTTGVVSVPVRGPDGYHLIRLESRKAASVSSARFWVEQDVIGEKLPKLIANAQHLSSQHP